MSRATSVGIVGGYGETGAVVARELFDTTDCDLVLAGRSIERAAELARTLGARASTLRVDVFDETSLTELARGCDVVVNCAGPSSVLLYRVATACMRHDCHYVDPGGYEALEFSLEHRQDELERRGLSFVSSAGFLPGLAEIFPFYADVEARTLFDVIESVEVFAADRNPWSTIGFLDIAWWIINSNEPGFFERGAWRQTGQYTSGRVFHFPAPLGRHVAVPYYKAELERFAAIRGYPRVAGYFGGLSLRTLAVMARVRARMRRRIEEAAVELEHAFRRDCERMGRGSAVVAVVKGKVGRRRRRLTGVLTQNRPDRHYWITGLVPATAARMLVEGRPIARGHHPICDAVDAPEFMAEMSRRGVEFELHYSGALRGSTSASALGAARAEEARAARGG
jgi:saccharopine dehydrogenase (NAD+, L-lysine-forming)